MGEAQTQTMETEEQILQQAEALATQSEWRKAAQVIGNAEKTVGLSPRARGTLAYYHSRAGDHPKAITLFGELCQLQPAEAKWHLLSGISIPTEGTVGPGSDSLRTGAATCPEVGKGPFGTRSRV